MSSRKGSIVLERESVPCALENNDLPPVTMRKQDILKSLKCPVCFELIAPPIMDCENGHRVCNICLEQLEDKKCPQCKCQAGMTRNRFAEEFFEKHIKLCCFASYGCKGNQWFENQEELLRHQESCKYRKINCWTPNCTDQLIGLDGLKNHWIQMHGLKENSGHEESHQFIVDPNAEVYQSKCFHLQHDGNSFLAIIQVLLKETKEVLIGVYVYGYCTKEMLEYYNYTVNLEYKVHVDVEVPWNGPVHYELQKPTDIVDGQQFFQCLVPFVGTQNQCMSFGLKIKVSPDNQRSRRSSLTNQRDSYSSLQETV